MNHRRLMLWLVPLVLIAGCQREPVEQASEGVIALGGEPAFKVNGEAVPRSLLAAFAERRGWDLNDPNQLEQARGELADLVAIAQEAKRRGLADSPMAEVERLNTLTAILMSKVASEPPITEEDLRRAYDEQIALTGNLEYQVRHLLFTDQASAQQALERWNAGEGFESLQAAYTGQANLREARDLGYVQLTQLPRPLIEAIKPLAPGQHTPTPVETEYGWHVAEVVATRSFTPPSFETVREGVKRTLEQRRTQELLQRLRAAAKVEAL